MIEEEELVTVMARELGVRPTQNGVRLAELTRQNMRNSTEFLQLSTGYSLQVSMSHGSVCCSLTMLLVRMGLTAEDCGIVPLSMSLSSVR